MVSSCIGAQNAKHVEQLLDRGILTLLGAKGIDEVSQFQLLGALAEQEPAPLCRATSSDAGFSLHKGPLIGK